MMAETIREAHLSLHPSYGNPASASDTATDTTTTITASIADLEAAPGRCELINGAIIDLSHTGFEHSNVVGAIAAILRPFIHQQRLGRLLVGDPGFQLDARNVRAPDVAVISDEQARAAPTRGFMPLPPRLAIEVVSPGDAWSDVRDKSRLWLSHGVALVWVVDTRSRSVQIHATDRSPVELRDDATIDGGVVLPGFSCRVAAFFD